MAHSWNRNREKIIKALKRGIESRGYPQKQMKILQGVLSYCEGDKIAQERYDQAVEDGATAVLIPWEKWRTGYVNIACCGMADGYYGQYPLHDRVELEIFDWYVWTCPRCDMVWALRTEMPDEDEEEELSQKERGLKCQ